MLSYAEIGPACMLSRAVGGLMGRVAVLRHARLAGGGASWR